MQRFLKYHQRSSSLSTGALEPTPQTHNPGSSFSVDALGMTVALRHDLLGL